MAKIDEIKELIGFLKAIFITLIVIDTSLIAWIFKNYFNEIYWKLYIVLFLIIIISFSIAKLFTKILKEIKSLKEIK
ncbi:MAG: hypothetical protein M0Q24_04150 [Sulfurimonas sp.]|uniref:hypothetical protein n=1 Tax=Sulfurimonas sp. TaxID=2022749 RepID=UPI0025FBF3B4|nr:hypothetical protein [Sulfurimonas sp.]MCK9491258.1 hypothetical protein [Sulfurimonas sp.]